MVKAEEAEAYAREAWRQVATTQWQSAVAEAATRQAAGVALQRVETSMGGQLVRMEIKLKEMNKSVEAYKVLLCQRNQEMERQEGCIAQLEEGTRQLQHQLRSSEAARSSEQAAAAAKAAELQKRLETADQERKALLEKLSALEDAQANLQAQLQTSQQEATQCRQESTAAEEASEQMLQKLSKATARQERVDELEKLNAYLRNQVREVKQQYTVPVVPQRSSTNARGNAPSKTSTSR